MFKDRPFSVKEVLQGDIYAEISFASANLTFTESKPHIQSVGLQLQTSVSHKWGMVISHSCDQNEATGRPSDRVLLAEVQEFSDYTRKLVDSRGGYARINSMELPKEGEKLYFPNIFYLDTHPDLGGHDHWVDFSSVRTVERSRLDPSKKLMQLDHDGGERLRYKLSLNFSRDEEPEPAAGQKKAE